MAFEGGVSFLVLTKGGSVPDRASRAMECLKIIRTDTTPTGYYLPGQDAVDGV